MADSALKLSDMQRSSIEFERQRHLANWLIKSGPHMPLAAPMPSQATTIAQVNSTTASTTPLATTDSTAAASNKSCVLASNNTITSNNTIGVAVSNSNQHYIRATTHQSTKPASNNNSNSVALYLTSNDGHSDAMASHSANSYSNCNHNCSAGMTGFNLSRSSQYASVSYPVHPPSTTAALVSVGATAVPAGSSSQLTAEGRKAKLRRFNSHDPSSNMFSVADFENARMARRNEIELKQRLARRIRPGGNANGIGTSEVTFSGSISGDYSTGDSMASKYSNESNHEPLPSDIFFERYSLPRVVRISYKTKYSNETMLSSSSNDSSQLASPAYSNNKGNVISCNTGTTNTMGTTTSSSTSSSGGGGHKAQSCASTAVIGINTSSTKGTASYHQDEGELFLLYRLLKQRYIYHGHNAKTAAANRKKGVLIPQEFPGYFSLINERGVPTATMYTSLMQLVRERVYKFISVDNMPAFTESQANICANPPSDGCLPLFSMHTSNRPHYVKTTARGGQIFRLLAVYEDGKQDHMATGNNVNISMNCNSNNIHNKTNGIHGRDKEKGRYAQILNENRQVLYVSLSTKGKFYEIEPGIPQILQRLTNDNNKKLNAECVYRITSLITPQKSLPQTLRYISGPIGCANAIPEQLCIRQISTENILVACPIEVVDEQSPLHLRKLHLTNEMHLVKDTLGFDNEQRMLANQNVQNILKYCQFNCDQFLKMVEIEVFNKSERSSSKSRVDGLKILKPLNLPRLLRREKTTIPAHEKEDSIIFLSKTELDSMDARDKDLLQKEELAKSDVEQTSSCIALDSMRATQISDKMKVFQSTKKKWFRKPDKHANSLMASSSDGNNKRLSLDRYSDVSKLLQERFGEKQAQFEYNSEHSAASDLGFSDTECAQVEHTVKQLGIKKSQSLQNIELCSNKNRSTASNCQIKTRKPDLISNAISEAGTDLEDTENFPPEPHSFITEKLYNEFHVKTKQYSKSSSSLHQLMNFSRPQKLNTSEYKRISLLDLKTQNCKSQGKRGTESNVEPVTGRRAAGELSIVAAAAASNGNAACCYDAANVAQLYPLALIEDDLPYSNVRDSLVLNNEFTPKGVDFPTTDSCQALHHTDYTHENIYAEICHEARAMGGIANSQTRDTLSADTHSTQLSANDDYGDYASLTYQTNLAPANISRVQINVNPSPVSYHTVYFNENSEAEHLEEQRKQLDKNCFAESDRSHITTLEVDGVNISESNIYSTLK